MGEVSTIGVDIAKSVFQIHGVDAEGAVVIRRRIGRAKVLELFTDLPPCLVGMDASLAWKPAQRRTSGHASSRS
jgi:transposase